jgi:hypothetical protein
MELFRLFPFEPLPLPEFYCVPVAPCEKYRLLVESAGLKLEVELEKVNYLREACPVKELSAELPPGLEALASSLILSFSLFI